MLALRPAAVVEILRLAAAMLRLAMAMDGGSIPLVCWRFAPSARVEMLHFAEAGRRLARGRWRLRTPSGDVRLEANPPVAYRARTSRSQ